ncbi:hypothetical protein AF332_20275 [Sporosarcina globispora]|uniref:Uncharacterized protein n=1 Tax=Sporosarcina globispora TaxID=1459 RepID=A0A0M0GHE2_SPOGL|nr:hypothetical protein AF332_20275 [Sporosarcina globispora]
MTQSLVFIYPENSIPSSIRRERNVNIVTNFHLFFISRKYKYKHARDGGINVYEIMSPIPGLSGEPKSIKSKILKISESEIHVAKPTIQKIIKSSTQLILFLGISKRLQKEKYLQ